MRILVESLKRLYNKGRVTLEKLEDMKAKGEITEEEFVYITQTNA